MFTGLVEEVGSMQAIRQEGETMVLHIRASVVMEDMKIGDSISVNGVCLTVTSYHNHSFAVDVMPQTYRHTNLKELRPGSRVNLERAMAANGRFGGHIVQGHVDGTGTILNKSRDQNAVVHVIAPDNPEMFRYIIPKGSITVDGISLTVVDTSETSLSISIIPHTLEATALAYKREGDSVNLECDVLGRYIEHLMRFGQTQGTSQPGSSKVDMSFLTEHGFA
ncbi:riboflavin synthase [Paenibacillus sp. CAA11]|uniref:riboflavin synthase n=1 Tax=Paenibacillus sp. CAA11 TaxID=1532905 RepID=UPI000D331C45|nr:riboflavin synthase [Paenibacillus sp. CAA11]AWB45053.1 riboflavin synthase [Paenibacillus sp. CAA11]